MKAQEPAANYEYTFGKNDLVLNARRKTLRIRGREAHLEPIPFEILTILLYRPRDIVDMTQHTYRTPQVIQNAMSKIRGELGDLAKVIETVKSRGYRFAGDVERRLIGNDSASDTLRPDQYIEDTPLKLIECLSANNEVEVWSVAADSGQQQIVKAAYTAKGTRRLEREASIWQLIREELGEQPDLDYPIGQDFSKAVRYLQFKDRGQDLEAWSLSSRALSEMGLDRRLALFDRMLTAVGKLHDIGVVHGDLKPKNWLISPSEQQPPGRQPVLSDLGNARLLNEQLFEKHDIPRLGMTITEPELTGSINYFAPELQHSEKPNMVSDVYALGITLYQFVAGDLRKPLASGWHADIRDEAMIELIEEVTQGKPENRLGSIEAFQQRLANLGQRRDDLESLRKYKRWKSQRPWIAGIVATALGGTLLSSVLAMHAIDAQRAAELEAKRKSEVIDFVTDVLRTANPRTESPSSEPPLIAALQRASQRLDTASTSDDSSSMLPVAEALRDFYGVLDEFESQIEEAQRVVRLNAQLHGDNHPETLLARLALIRTLSVAGETDKARALFDAMSIEHLSGENLAHIRFHQTYTLGRINSLQLDFASAAEHYATARELLAKYAPNDALTLQELTLPHAEALARTNQLESAIAMLNAVTEPEFVADAAIPKWRQINANRLKAQVLGFLQRHDEAVALLEMEIINLREMYGEQSFRVANTYTTLAHQKSALGLFDESIRDLEKAIPTLCNPDNGIRQFCALTRGNLGVLQFHKDDSAATVQQLTLAREAIRQITDSAVAVSMFEYYLANALIDTREFQQARALSEGLQASDIEQAAPDGAWATRLRILSERLDLAEASPEARNNAARNAVERLVAEGVSSDEAARVAGL